MPAAPHISEVIWRRAQRVALVVTAAVMGTWLWRLIGAENFLSGVVALAALALLVMMPLRLRRRLRRANPSANSPAPVRARGPCCVRCGYPLHDLAPTEVEVRGLRVMRVICPECGHADL